LPVGVCSVAAAVKLNRFLHPAIIDTPKVRDFKEAKGIFL